MKSSRTKTFRKNEAKKAREKKFRRAKSERGSDRIEGGNLPLYAYLSNDPIDDPRGPLDDR